MNDCENAVQPWGEGRNVAAPMTAALHPDAISGDLQASVSNFVMGRLA
jgi:hypothetical protein